MMNRKGFTLMELMISISLVSIVMVFTLNLLNDIRAEEALGTNKTADLTNRTIITRIVQDDFYQKGIAQIGYQVDPSAPGRYCSLARGVFSSGYNFYIRKCVVIFYKDNSCGLLAVGSTTATGEPNLFMYAKKSVDYNCNVADNYVPEIWELSSATYDLSDEGAGIVRSANTIENVEENQ